MADIYRNRNFGGRDYWNNSSNLIYNNLTYSNVTRSGNTITVNGLTYWFTTAQTSYNYYSPYNFPVNISIGYNTANENFAIPYNSSGFTNSGNLNIGTRTFNVDTNDSSKGVTLSTENGSASDATIKFTGGVTISSLVPGVRSVAGTVTVSGWGDRGNSSTRYRNLSICAAKNNDTRRYQRVYGDALTGVIEVTNDTQYGTMTIVPNTRYYVWAYATPEDNYGSSVANWDREVVTLAEAPTVSVGSTGDNTITIVYETFSDGGHYAKNLQYSLDSGATWTTGATVSSGSVATGSYTIPNLSEGTDYTILTRVSTTSGTTTGDTLTASTTHTTNAVLYGSVNGQSKKVTRLYGAVPGVTANYRITELDGVESADATKLLSILSGPIATVNQVPKLLIENKDVAGHHIQIRTSDGTVCQLYYSDENTSPKDLGIWFYLELEAQTGIVIDPGAEGNIFFDYDVLSVTKQIKKLYASVNGKTRLVYEA